MKSPFRSAEIMRDLPNRYCREGLAAVATQSGLCLAEKPIVYSASRASIRRPAGEVYPCRL